MEIHVLCLLERLQGNKLLYLPLQICKNTKAAAALTSLHCFCAALLIWSWLCPSYAATFVIPVSFRHPCAVLEVASLGKAQDMGILSFFRVSGS